MNSSFKRYLLTIGIIVFIIALIVIVIFKRSKKKSVTYVEKDVEPITSGNVSIFFDRQTNMTIIPYGRGADNRGVAVSYPVILKGPLTQGQIGEAVRAAMTICKDGEPCSDEELMEMLGCSNWKAFTQGKRCISVNYAPKRGVVLNSTLRNLEGIYCFNSHAKELVVNASAGNTAIGTAVLVSLSRCKA